MNRRRRICRSACASPAAAPSRIICAAHHRLAQDKRIEFLGLDHARGGARLPAQLDVLAVPSNYMETGPLVVLEAQVFGIPVMGADLGGISERIRDGVDGWLLPFEDSSAWAAAIQEIALDRRIVEQRAAGIGRTRTMGDVAVDMAELYRDILQRRPEVQNEALQRPMQIRESQGPDISQGERGRNSLGG